MESVDSEAEEDFTNPIDVLLSNKTVKFVLVFKEDHLSRLFSFRLPFVFHYFVVLSQLDLIGFDHLGNFRFG